jgi:phage repressor protein C with HTH and peptisase S24 domain
VIDQETEIGRWVIPKDYVRHGLSLRSPETSLSLITVAGDSMVPTLFPGDVIMVDLADKNPSNPGIFVLYADGVTVVKRLERIPTIRPPKLRLISDNQKHTPYDVLASLVNIAGRVVWFARRM